MDSALETKRAMFRAAIAAQVAGESSVGAHRIVAALLRTDSVQEFCARAEINCAGAADAIDEAALPPGAELQLRPLDVAVQGVLDDIIAKHGAVAVPPLELLLAIIRADEQLAEQLAAYGLSAEAIAAALPFGLP